MWMVLLTILIPGDRGCRVSYQHHIATCVCYKGKTRLMLLDMHFTCISSPAQNNTIMPCACYDITDISADLKK